jgi:hypothetical protein
VNERPFLDRFCDHFHCSPSDYEPRALKEFLYFPARLLRPVLRILRPGHFTRDLTFIRDLGATTDWRGARAEVQGYVDDVDAKRGLFRNFLKLRVSGRKASRLARLLFSAETAMDETAEPHAPALPPAPLDEK